ncbi:16S rRNA (cytosine(1402)-N(4))-methyltransferase RsmH [Marinicellulosiphila megalodicopiae]|uniref:16S rRNA (cytosine(1402)-N(4))-methyltransferase RsmH n=1 Tax=Marinicellulosiphila megalodicopiae TaxID=2724896 RepID=UPI003BB127C8
MSADQNMSTQDTSFEYKHVTVLLNEAVDAMGVAKDTHEAVYIDCTFGRGGHSKLILQTANPKSRLIGIDKDDRAIETANELAANDGRFKIVKDSFAQLKQIATDEGLLGQVDAILMDLGVSSPQLDEADRGFSFMNDGPLDMRMDTSSGISAAQWVNETDENTMMHTFFDYGEEKFSRRIAKAICEHRETSPFTRTKELADVVAKAHPKWQKGKNPATRIFQAIRIKINQELDDLEQALADVLDVLKPGGRLVVISFHSLEDRIVKRFIKRQCKGDELPRGLPVFDQDLNQTMKMQGKAIKPTAHEIDINPRSRSAVMRAAVKL